MQVRGQLGKLGASTLFLSLLLIPCDITIVVVKVAAHFFILRLHVLKVLLARVEVMLPTSRIVPTVAKVQKDTQRLGSISGSASIRKPASVCLAEQQQYLLTIFKQWLPSGHSKTSVEFDFCFVSYRLLVNVQCARGRP